MLKKTAALAAAALMALTLASCGDTKSSSAETPEKSSSQADPEARFPESDAMFKEKFGNVPDAEEGPVLSFSNTEAEPGGVAEVTLSIKGAEGKWSMCGIHIVHPKELVCRIAHEEDLSLERTLGDACDDNLGFVTRKWVNDLPEELEKNGLGCFFFTTLFDQYGGHDGDIVTFYFDVPKDAEPGTVYPIEIYYRNTDMIRDIAQDPSFEKYAYSHAIAGSVTVK